MVMIGSTSLRSRKIVDQFAQLRRALDVAPEKNEAAGLHAPKQCGRFGIELFPARR